MEDEELVELALARPEAGFAEIYDRYAGRLYDYCYGILRSADDAGDALQDTFVAALTKLPQLRDPSRLRPWLYAIARNCCFKRSLKRTRERSAENIELIMPAQEEQTQPVESAELQQLVWTAVGGLSETDRAVIDLNVRHGLEGEELASALGLSPSRSYVVVHRAKSRLEASVSALLVTKAGTEACDELRLIVGTGEFTPLIRKRVNRHLGDCEVCQETERENRPSSLLALVPFVRLPADLRGKTLARLDMPAAGGAGDGSDLGWRSDGFPAPVSASRFGPGLQGAALAVACVAIILIIGFAPLGRLPGIGSDGSDDVTAAVGPTTAVDQAATDPTSTTLPTTAAATETEPETSTMADPPAGDNSSDTTGGATTVPPSDPPASGVTSPGSQVVLDDLQAPLVSALQVICADPFVLELTVTDNLDPDPTVDLEATWENESSPPALLVNQGEGLYQAKVPGDERVGETIVFWVRGAVTDSAGNTRNVDLSESCRFLD